MGKTTSADKVAIVGFVGGLLTGLVIVSNGICQIIAGDEANSRTAHSGDGARYSGIHGIAQGAVMALTAIGALIYKYDEINTRVDAPPAAAPAPPPQNLNDVVNSLRMLEEGLRADLQRLEERELVHPHAQ